MFILATTVRVRLIKLNSTQRKKTKNIGEPAVLISSNVPTTTSLTNLGKPM